MSEAIATVSASRSATRAAINPGPDAAASHVGAGRAISFGYKNVYEMFDGIQGWVNAGKQVQSI